MKQRVRKLIKVLPFFAQTKKGRKKKRSQLYNEAREACDLSNTSELVKSRLISQCSDSNTLMKRIDLEKITPICNIW